MSMAFRSISGNQFSSSLGGRKPCHSLHHHHHHQFRASIWFRPPSQFSNTTAQNRGGPTSALSSPPAKTTVSPRLSSLESHFNSATVPTWSSGSFTSLSTTLLSLTLSFPTQLPFTFCLAPGLGTML